jgi:hypothetical protein
MVTKSKSPTGETAGPGPGVGDTHEIAHPYDTTDDTERQPLPDLFPAHLAMLRDESGISDEVIRARGYRTITDPQDLAEMGFSRSQRRVPGLLLPLWDTSGENSLYIYRPDNPRVTEQKRKGRQSDGTYPCKVLKYELPKGCKMRLDCPPVCQPQLADPSVPLWVTEGQKKADCLASRGLCSITLLGVWSWRGQNDADGLTALPDWEHVALNGRQVNIVFDSDVTTKPDVQKALNRFRSWLQYRGATVGVVYLPHSEDGRNGVDDYLAASHTIANLEALISGPRPEPKPAPPIIELLDKAPASLRRPLALVDGQSYAATWLYCRKTITESVSKHGEIIRHDPPIITNERQLFIVRKDGKVFSDGGDEPIDALDMEVRLPERPQDSSLWSTAGIQSYRAGERPNPAEVFNRVVDVVDRFIDFNRSLADQRTMAEMVACYTIGTWFLPSLNVVGYLWPNGPRGSGKTVLLFMVAEMAYLGQVILAGGSYASLRDLADYGATLCFDDAENLGEKTADLDKRALLLAGNRRGSTVTVKELTADKVWKTRHVNAFCPRLFSAIKLPDNVLASRTIVIPLIRTLDRNKANVDPVDYDLWPHERRELVDDLWALALAHLPEVQAHDKAIAKKASLIGRSLDPWRIILATASWLDEKGVEGLWERMNSLSVAYQTEKLDLEKGDMVSLVLKALCQCATSATSATNKETIVFFDINVEKIRSVARDIVAEGDPDAKVDWVTSSKIGRTMAQMRFEQLPRPGGRGSRIYRISLDELIGWLTAYGLPLPAEFSENLENVGGTLPVSGTSGTSGTLAQEGQGAESWASALGPSAQGPSVPGPEDPGRRAQGAVVDAPSLPGEKQQDAAFDAVFGPAAPCRVCGGLSYWQRPDGGWLCSRCHPPV